MQAISAQMKRVLSCRHYEKNVLALGLKKAPALPEKGVNGRAAKKSRPEEKKAAVRLIAIKYKGIF